MEKQSLKHMLKYGNGSVYPYKGLASGRDYAFFDYRSQAQCIAENRENAFLSQLDNRVKPTQLERHRETINESPTAPIGLNPPEDLAWILESANLLRDTPTQPLYQPLSGEQSTRLLILDAKSSNKLSCQLLPADLKNIEGRYEALSYCWHDDADGIVLDSERPQILCNKVMVCITQNLYQALLHLQLDSQPRVLWIDALCINQGDMAERASQVQLMETIYSNCSRVVIWLGMMNSLTISKSCIAVHDLVNNWRARKAASRTTLSGRQEWQSRGHDEEYYHLQDPSPFELISHIFKSKWFSRRWIIQEVVLAPDALVLLPGATIDWQWVALAAGILRTNHLPKMERYNVTNNICNGYLLARLANTFALPKLDLSFLYLLRLAAGFETSESLDAVYALLGLGTRFAQVGRRLLLCADYSRTESDLGRALVEQFLETEEPLNFLSDAGTQTGRSAGAPSWIPDYRPRKYTMLSYWALDGQNWLPARGIPFVKFASKNAKELVVNGRKVAPIIWKSDSLLQKREIMAMMVTLLRLMHCFVDTSTIKKLQVLAYTLTAARDTYGKLMLDREFYIRDLVKHMLEWANRVLPAKIAVRPLRDTLRHVNDTLRMSIHVNPEDKDNFLDILLRICKGRSLFVTSSGHLGLGPEDIQIGDAVFALGGATMLHVLRQGVDGHVLIGDCFIDGLMNGEIQGAMDANERIRGPISTAAIASHSGKGSSEVVYRDPAIYIQTQWDALSDILYGEIAMNREVQWDATSDILDEDTTSDELDWDSAVGIRAQWDATFEMVDWETALDIQAQWDAKDGDIKKQMDEQLAVQPIVII